MTAEGRPQRGEKWRSRARGTTETRTVIDETLGGSVVYIEGRLTRDSFSLRGGYKQGERQCTLSQWKEWAKTAKLISSLESEA